MNVATAARSLTILICTHNRADLLARVIDSLEGVEFLRKIGAALPESLKKRVIDLELKPKFEMKLIAGLTQSSVLMANDERINLKRLAAA